MQTLAPRLQHHDSGGQRPLREIADALIDESDSTVDDDLALLLLSLMPFGASLVPE